MKEKEIEKTEITEGIKVVTHTDGSWVKTKRDRWGNVVWYEDSNGYWRREKFNAKGEVLVSEDAIGGY